MIIAAQAIMHLRFIKTYLATWYIRRKAGSIGALYIACMNNWILKFFIFL